MLYDFLLLEQYYEAPQTVFFYEDLSRRYSPRAIKKALEEGDLLKRRIHCGPDCGRLMFWLSDKGREKARDRKVFA